VTRTPLSKVGVKGQHVNTSGSCSGDRENVLTVGTYCYVAVCRRGRLDGARRFGTHRGRGGIFWRPPAYSLLCKWWLYGKFMSVGPIESILQNESIRLVHKANQYINSTVLSVLQNHCAYLVSSGVRLCHIL